MHLTFLLSQFSEALSIPVNNVVEKKFCYRIEFDSSPEEPATLACKNSMLILESAVRAHNGFFYEFAKLLRIFFY